MKLGTRIIYRPNRQGEQKHAKVIDTIVQMGSTAYLVETRSEGIQIVYPNEMDIIEHEHATN